MKFAISRTSTFLDGKSPCDEAYEDHYVRIDERTADDPQKIPCFKGTNKWYEEGRNHRVEDGRIKRDFDDKAWFINVDDLDGILWLEKKYGDLIIQHFSNNKSILEIEIYDNYRE